MAGAWASADASQATDCGNVSIAEMNWGSAGVAAHVDKIILENGYLVFDGNGHDALPTLDLPHEHQPAV